MPRPSRCLPALLLSLFPAAAWAQGPVLPERVRDDFATDSRGKYQSKGEVAWQKGALTLGSDATLSRKVGLGQTADVELTLAFPAVKVCWAAKPTAGARRGSNASTCGWYVRRFRTGGRREVL